MEKLTVEKINEIAEELRTTKIKGTGHLAWDYIWEKHGHLFDCKERFIRCMDICSVFFACQPNVEEIRKNTTYKYV